MRALLAERSVTTVNYLYALAGCHRESGSVQLAFAIEEASKELHEQTSAATSVATAHQIATMCAVRAFDSLS